MIEFIQVIVAVMCVDDLTESAAAAVTAAIDKLIV
jgi:hypothetical protein